MKKRILALFLAVCALMSLTAMGASADAEINYLPDYETLADAQPTIRLNDVPEGSTDVSYGWINNIPAIDQIDFTYDGHSYCFRAAACPAGTASLDISGVDEHFSAISTVEISDENRMSGSYVLRYDAKSGRGIANWASDMAETQYSLYSEDACLGKVQDMPFVEVMEMLYTYDQGAKSVSGTVLDTTDNTLALNLTNGNSVVLNCEHIGKITVESGDTVSVLYLGEIDGDAEVVRILPVEGDESFLSGDTFSGNIFRYIDNLIYVLTDDENIYPFEITSATAVTGAANTLAENEDVVVTFEGDLYSDPYVPPVALEVNVTYVGATPKPEPTPTPGPAYIDRYIDGTVTSVAGSWITVKGVAFDLSNAAYITGTPKVGSYAAISYRDYGSGYYVVTNASFTSAPGPVPEAQVYGPVYSYDRGSNIVVGITASRGQMFNISSRTKVSGYYTENCYAQVYYEVGTLNATYIIFDAPIPTPTPTPAPRLQISGNAYYYTGRSVNIAGVQLYITGSTGISGYYTDGCPASAVYYPSGEALEIIFYTPAPTPVPTPVPTEAPLGPAGAGWTCTVCGMRNGVYDQFCSRCGSPRVDGGETHQHATGFGGMANPFAN